MKRLMLCYPNPIRNWIVSAALLLAAMLLPNMALALNVTVVDGNGAPITVPFRWQLEEDNTVWHVPGVIDIANSVTLSIHKSHAPVEANGSSAGNPANITVPDPAKRYYISVLVEGYQLGSAQVAANQAAVRVIVTKHRIPTAQISVFAFVDHFPINNGPDIGEPGLAGFEIKLYDGAGYFAAGDLSQDAFGNPLGTTYQTDALGNYLEDADGNPVVDQVGTGAYLTDANGQALIKNLAPGKYGIQVIPRTPQGGDAGGWLQTTTIEGTVGIDAWVKGNEPRWMIEFGLGMWHIFTGFINTNMLPWNVSPPAGGATITGRLVNNHFSKPPGVELFLNPGAPVPEGWIALNDIQGTGGGVYAAACDPEEGTFTINNVPDGTYQLVTFDRRLIRIIGFTTLIVTNGANVALGDLVCNAWFGEQQGSVFYDEDQDGFRDPNEGGIPLQNINLRFRDGTMYGNTVTDINGDYELIEIFPFFKWLITEVDFARFKATGATIVVDDGGEVPPANGWQMPSFDKLNPQPQAEVNINTGNNLSRTETGVVLLEAFQDYAGMVNWIDWGKINYPPGENGGISGIAFYVTTRAEEDPREAVGDAWEPGIPRVQFALYQDAQDSLGNLIPDKIIDDVNDDGMVTLADVDNHPLGWAEGGAKGTEDVDHNANNVFDQGDAIQVVWSDCFDDNPPTGSRDTPPPINGQPVPPGSDSFGTWNQVRPGVFDGGYAFSDVPPGMYIVQACPPPGYLIQTEESMNVVFGDAFTPSKLALFPECVGTIENHGGAAGNAYVSRFVPGIRFNPYTVPSILSLFPNAAEPAPFAGQVRPLADMKWVQVSTERNAAADFHIYTEVPKAARAVGLCNNDLGAAFNPAFPTFGEKDTPLWIPISFQDWAGNEVSRVYADPFGGYNTLLPSTYSINVPMPSGVSPNMVVVVLNDPTMPDPANPGQRIPDPRYDPDYATSAYPLQYFPGTTTYPDTPVLPIGAFVGGLNKRMDVESPEGTPMIHSVDGPFGGPLLTPANNALTIRSMGPTEVLNPENTALNGQPLMIIRDYGFGATQGDGSVTINGIPLNIVSWSDAVIQATAPANVPSGQLLVTRGNGLTSRIGVTVTIAASATLGVRHVVWAPYPATPIQDAIDAAQPGDLILVGPGEYKENPIMWKPVKLQGAGMGTVINAAPLPSERTTSWHAKASAIYGTPGSDPFQINATGPSANAMAGITVCGDAGSAFGPQHRVRIDGFSIVGGQSGGGVYLFKGARDVTVSNNRIRGNRGQYAGGIAVGSPGSGPSGNVNVLICNNEILKNGTAAVNLQGGAGGVSLFTGADDYVVRDNIIQGNLSTANGGGIAHLGLSQRGRIANNQILFNEVISDVLGYGAGGGIYLAGEALIGALTPGAGTVTIVGNLIQGNLGGAGHGGGIRTERFNGTDVVNNPGNQAAWHALNIFNNVIANNVAGYAGGGISIEDAVKCKIIHNTVAHNDATSTAALAFVGAAASSQPQGAGIVAHVLSVQLALASGQTFAKPVLHNNIVWHNRSYYLDATLNGGVGGLAPNPTGLYWDLQVFGAIGQLDPRFCILTSTAGYHGSNLQDDPDLILAYFNTLQHASVTDEARRAIWVRYDEINPQGNYHIADTSPAVSEAGTAFRNDFADLRSDWDRQFRPQDNPDIGADEALSLAPEVIAVNDSYTASEGQNLDVQAAAGVLANDSGPGPLTAVLNRLPAHGTLTTFQGSGRFIYSPASGFAGTDTFTYWARVGTVYSLEATVTITVNPFNGIPIALPDTYSANGSSPAVAATLTVPAPGVLGNDTDADGDALTAVLVTGPSQGGTLVLNPDGSFAYTPPPGVIGNVVFQYQASDGQALSDIEDVLITVTAPQPDFTVTAITLIPQTVWAGSPFTAQVTVQNIGSAQGDAGTLTVWVNQQSPVPPGTAGNGSIAVGVLAAGASTTVELALTAPDLLAPTFRAYANSTGLPEFTENDNQSTLTYGVRTGTSFQALTSDTDGVDTDGDGIVDNDFVYMHVAGGDGFAKMADGNELYAFGFHDHTALALSMAQTQPSMILPTIMYDGRLKADISAPTIRLKEGQRFYLDLSNVGMDMRPDLFDPHTIHFHGYPQAASIFDGEPFASLAVNPAAMFRYYYQLNDPGTFIYHCHMEATEHMEMGMLGSIYVMPKQNYLPVNTPLAKLPPGKGNTHQAGYKYVYNDGDGSTYYDVEYPLQLSAFDRYFHELHIAVQPLPFATLDESYPMINGRGYPDTVNPNPIASTLVQERLGLDAPYPSQKISSRITATQGQYILLRINNVSLSDFHTITVLGIPMRVVGKDANLLRGPTGLDLTYQTTSVTLGGGETTEVILDTTSVVPGTYFLYDARLNHLCNDEEDFGGMMTEIIIAP